VLCASGERLNGANKCKAVGNAPTKTAKDRTLRMETPTNESPKQEEEQGGNLFGFLAVSFCVILVVIMLSRRLLAQRKEKNIQYSVVTSPSVNTKEVEMSAKN
jgi:hypothetical protein